MYKQEIVVDPYIFEKIEKDIYFDFKNYYENLKNKKIVIDISKGKSYLNDLYLFITGRAKYESKKRMEEIIKYFYEYGNFNQADKKDFSALNEDNHINILFNLALKTEYKIINSENKKLENEKNLKRYTEGIEIVNTDTFIKPGSRSRVFALNRVIKVNTTESFKFEEIFKPYVVDSKKLVFNDLYIRNRSRGMVNLLKIIKIVKKPESIEIRTIMRENNTKDNFDVTCEELKEEVYKAVKIEPVILEAKTKNRTLETDDFEFSIQPGFDFVTDNYEVRKNPIMITITQKNF